MKYEGGLSHSSWVLWGSKAVASCYTPSPPGRQGREGRRPVFQGYSLHNSTPSCCHASTSSSGKREAGRAETGPITCHTLGILSLAHRACRECIHIHMWTLCCPCCNGCLCAGSEHFPHLPTSVLSVKRAFVPKQRQWAVFTAFLTTRASRTPPAPATNGGLFKIERLERCASTDTVLPAKRRAGGEPL